MTGTCRTKSRRGVLLGYKAWTVEYQEETDWLFIYVSIQGLHLAAHFFVEKKNLHALLLFPPSSPPPNLNVISDCIIISH